MLTLHEQERLGNDIIRATYEVVDLDDFASQVFPLINRLLDTSTSLLYRCNERHEIVPIVGGMTDSIPFYSQNYFSIDPLQQVLQKFNPIILQGSTMPNWKEYLVGPAYLECATRNGIDNFLHLRLNDCDMYEPGMVGIMVARTFRQPDFSEREKILVGTLMPALEAFTRRNNRLEDRLKAHPFIETLYEFSERPTVALDLRGGFLWASERAEILLGITHDGHKRVPEVLEKAANQLGTLFGKKSRSTVSPPPARVKILRKDEVPVHADLRLARTRNGAYFIVAELEDPQGSPRLAEIAARHQLTKTETQVLHLISLGLSDREISRRLFVSLATVHSHVNHILGKLAVNSRIQAALIAHGRKPTT